MGLFNIVLAAIPGFVEKPTDLGLPTVSAESGVGSVLTIVFTIVGILSVIFIVVGGLRYTLSGCDSAGIKSAKDTIINAIVGLVISLLALGIVNYVTNIK